MSDLIEKVARAMYPTWWETIDTCADGPDCDSCPLDRAHSLGKARAAILAVAEWLDTQGDEQWYPGERLREQLERLRGEK